MDRETSDAVERAVAAGAPFGIAAFAGFIKYLQRVFLADVRETWHWGVFLAQVLTAGFVGVLAFWLLKGWNIDPGYRSFAIAVAGYGGGETITLVQKPLFDWLARIVGNGPPKN